jgi:hypothetical protein
MTRIAHIALAVVVAVTAARTARADEPRIVVEPSTKVDPETPRVVTPIGQQAAPTPTWYGWQTLLADGAGFAATASCFGAFGNHDGGLLCLVPLVGASAVVHAAHHNPGRALLSVAMMTVLPYVGDRIGMATADCGKDELFCGWDDGFVGLAVGLAAAMTLDVAFAYTTQETPRPIARRGPSFMPTLAINPRGGAGVGLVGQF